MRLTGITVHPVKSTAIRPVPAAVVLPAGLVDDRTWIVVDGDGVMVSAREARELLRVEADSAATEEMNVSTPSTSTEPAKSPAQ